MTGDGLDETLIDAFKNVLVWARTHQEEVVALLEVSWGCSRLR